MLWLKYVHIACVILSGSGYLIRGLWMIRESLWLQKKWVRVLPHVIDTTLLGSAILLAIQLQQYPFIQGWLTAKVLALIAYIVIGAIGLKYGKTKKSASPPGSLHLPYSCISFWSPSPARRCLLPPSGSPSASSASLT